MTKPLTKSLIDICSTYRHPGRNLPPYIVLLFFFFMFAGMRAFPVYAAERNSCIECHKDLPQGTYIGHKYSDYVGSVHDRNGIRCEACHGGTPSRFDQTAHEGVYRSSNPVSSVYYQNIPRTCGKCHGKELVSFSRSKHYLKLETSGRGPSCATCHGSMGTFILNAEQIQKFCVICHNLSGPLPDKPREVEETLSLMEQTDTMIRWSEEFVAIAQKQGRQVSGAEKAMKEAHESMSSARDAWHSFNMEEVRLRIRRAYLAAKEAKEKIR